MADSGPFRSAPALCTCDARPDASERFGRLPGASLSHVDRVSPAAPITADASDATDGATGSPASVTSGAWSSSTRKRRKRISPTDAEANYAYCQHVIQVRPSRNGHPMFLWAPESVVEFAGNEALATLKKRAVERKTKRRDTARVPAVASRTGGSRYCGWR